MGCRDGTVRLWDPATGKEVRLINGHKTEKLNEGWVNGLAFSRDGKTLVQFAGWKHPVSLYPVPGTDPAFAAELAPYLAGKGTLRFFFFTLFAGAIYLVITTVSNFVLMYLEKRYSTGVRKADL